jgi:hypothetical protein
MILSLFIYLAANQGILVAQPIVINAVALGSIVENAVSYERGMGIVGKEGP